MTSFLLLLWIVSAVALQVTIYFGISFWQHWREYQGLQRKVAGESGAADMATDAGALTPAWSGFRNFRVGRKVFEDSLESICSFYLIPEDGQALPPFLPGQFLTFRLDIPTADGRSEQLVRCYSLSDAPRSDGYRVSIKRAPAPASSSLPPGKSSSYFHDHVQVGSVLQVRAPSGHFYLSRSDAPVVLIGGGIGITPMLSMLNWCLLEQPGREVWLFYGVRDSRELVMTSHLMALAAAHPNFHFVQCLSQPLPTDLSEGGYFHQGRIDVELLRLKLPLKPFHFYICGPTALLESLVPALEDWGIPDGRIHFEAFGPSSIVRKHAHFASAAVASADADTDIVVSFARSGKQLAWQPGAQSLLDFAEANGISVNSGCRAGGCGSCQVRIDAGEVAYRQAPDFDPEPGTCLLCVCLPKTSVTLEA